VEHWTNLPYQGILFVWKGKHPGHKPDTLFQILNKTMGANSNQRRPAGPKHSETQAGYTSPATDDN